MYYAPIRKTHRLDRKQIAMQLTQEVLDRYIGGQIEVQNPREGYLRRGEIATISIDLADLVVTLKWMAEGEGFPPLPKRWVNCADLFYEANAMFLSARDMGPGLEGGGTRLFLEAHMSGEIITLFPPDGSKLDRSQVVGLEPAAVMVPIDLLLKDCAFPMKADVRTASDTCRAHATSAVDVGNGHQMWRCEAHRGLIKPGVSGDVLESILQTPPRGFVPASAS